MTHIEANKFNEIKHGLEDARIRLGIAAQAIASDPFSAWLQEYYDVISEFYRLNQVTDERQLNELLEKLKLYQMKNVTLAPKKPFISVFNPGLESFKFRSDRDGRAFIDLAVLSPTNPEYVRYQRICTILRVLEGPIRINLPRYPSPYDIETRSLNNNPMCFGAIMPKP